MEIRGVLVVNKPQSFTSFDVVAKLRGILRTKKIGHGGTLDPLATGVLPIFIGGATKAADFAAAQNKEYVAGFKLGVSTDTQDISGKVINKTDKTASKEQVVEMLNSFKGKSLQLPPMYSAIKIGGQKLYDLARKGREIERPKREIDISEIELLSFDEQKQEGVFRVLSSKGTYIRTICNDLGEKLGTFGTMSGLERTKSGVYSIGNSYTLDDIQKYRDENKIEEIIIPVDTLFMEYKSANIDDFGKKRAEHGAFISKQHTDYLPKEGTILRIYHNGEFLMLGIVSKLQKGGNAIFCYKKFL